MKVLQGILAESKAYYLDAQKRIEKKLLSLAKGSVKERKIGKKKYYYLQYRQNQKVIQKYLGRQKPQLLIVGLKARKSLKSELKRVREALKIIKRAEGRKRD